MTKLKKILAAALALSLLTGFSASVDSFANETSSMSEPYVLKTKNLLSVEVNNIKAGDVYQTSDDCEPVTYILTQNENPGNISSINCNTNITALHIPETLNGIPVKITRETILNLGNIDRAKLVVFLPLNPYNNENEQNDAINILIKSGIVQENIMFYGKG